DMGTGVPLRAQVRHTEVCRRRSLRELEEKVRYCMKTIIVGHHSRVEWIGQLQDALPGSAAIVDYADEGAQAGHRKALELAQAVGERCVIIEDDAIPVQGFASLAEYWCDKFPDDLISFYL